MRIQVAWTVRSAPRRSRVLSLAKTCLMGFRSGLFGGRKNSLAFVLRMAWRR